MSAAREQRFQSSYTIYGAGPSSPIAVSSGACSTTLASRFIGVHVWSYVMVCGALTSDWYSCMKNYIAPSTRWASTGTARSIRHLSQCVPRRPSASFAWPRNIQLTAEAGPALRSFARCVALVSVASESRQFTDLFTRIAEMAVLSCCRASSSGSCTSLKATALARS